MGNSGNGSRPILHPNGGRGEEPAVGSCCLAHCQRMVYVRAPSVSGTVNAARRGLVLSGSLPAYAIRSCPVGKWYGKRGPPWARTVLCYTGPRPCPAKSCTRPTSVRTKGPTSHPPRTYRRGRRRRSWSGPPRPTRQ